MPSKSMEARTQQKAYWESKLNQRLAQLSEAGLDPARIAKDAAVRKLRASLRATEERLNVIEDRQKKKEEMARLKAEKLATPKEDKNEKKRKKQEAEEQTLSKRQQKKQKKREGKAQPAA